MEIEKKIDELQALVSKYDTESFTGFFAYFIKRRPNDFDLNKFKSKLKDFLYLIALNVFSEIRGTTKFEHPTDKLGILADKVNEIKDYYKVKEFKNYTKESVIHEMAFRNHFDNGILSYVEQDLEKIRTVFTPFEDEIIQDFGFDINFLIEIYKEIELISLIRFKYVMRFSFTKEFIEFNQRIFSYKMNFSESFDLLPPKIQDAFLSFQSKTYAYLMFTAEDLYHRLSKDKVDKFLELFTCEPTPNPEIRYYATESPFDLAPILKLSEGSYLNLYQKQIPIAIYKKMYEHLSKDKRINDKLRKHREKSLEWRVTEIFKSLFPSNSTFFYENYFVKDNFEQDLLILYKGNAIIVETKASKLREPFRNIQKAIIRLKDDFKDAIQYGFDQCKRVEDYFFDTEPFDVKNEKGKVLYTVNPNKIHSIYSVVVTLERFGSLQTDLSLMLDKSKDIDYPWSVYIDDLETFLLTLKHTTNNPTGKFLDFLKLRREMHGHLYAIDELDICAVYIQNPTKFTQYSKKKDSLLRFSPHEQAIFDQLYFDEKIHFKEKSLPDDYYKFDLK
ncbi:hypothetical protein [Gelidibacter japonicus]|uniref:hypothetical protein n=1 Tax=Gelidibacter japonicus TaxID=1962232 RepID=UPI0013D20BF0|nr:hypothetical protein [Gelidibacter japonicus]